MPFGESFVEQQASVGFSNPYKFTGHELDKQTGLYYAKARFYSPKRSIFLSVDPLANYNPVFETEHYGDGQHNGGIFNDKNLNTYGYCYGNPVVLVDPNGKQTTAPGIYNTAFVYHVKGNMDVNHTSVGYYGKYDRNKTVLYAPLSGNSTYRENRIDSDGNSYSGVSETKTIKHYLDNGDSVERYHYKINDKYLSDFQGTLEADVINNGVILDDLYCTLQAKQAFHEAFGGKFNDKFATKGSDKIIPYNFPTQLTKDELLSTGSVRFDVFSKQGNEYFMQTHTWDPRNVGKNWFEKVILGKDGWSQGEKKQIKLD